MKFFKVDLRKNLLTLVLLVVCVMVFFYINKNVQENFSDTDNFIKLNCCNDNMKKIKKPKKGTLNVETSGGRNQKNF